MILRHYECDECGRLHSTTLLKVHCLHTGEFRWRGPRTAVPAHWTVMTPITGFIRGKEWARGS